MSNEPVAILYIYRRAGYIVSAAIAQVPPEPPGDGWDTLTRIPISNNGRPAWRTFTVRHGHEGQDFIRRHWSGDVAGLLDNAAPKVGDTIVYNGRQCRILAITGDGRKAFIRDLVTRQAIEIELPISQEKGTCR